MADTWWNRIENFIYDHGPKPVRDWMDRRTLDREADEQYKLHTDRVASGFYDQPEGRDDEILRLYTEALGKQAEVGPVITKPIDLESYRQEQAFYNKHSPDANEQVPFVAHEDYEMQQTLNLLQSAHTSMQAAEREPNDSILQEAARIVERSVSQDEKAMETIGWAAMAVVDGRIVVDFDGSSDKPIYIKSQDIAAVLQKHDIEVGGPFDEQAAIEARQQYAEDKQWETLSLRSPDREARREAAAFADELPMTDRAIVANDLNMAAEYRLSGDLRAARHMVEIARQDRMMPTRQQEQEFGISR